MKFSPFDEVAMRRALELAARGLYSTHPNPRVGAVLAPQSAARVRALVISISA